MAEMGLFEAMYSARAIRRLKPDPVPDALLVKVIDAGIRAPSGSNAQNWVFIVVKDPQRRARLAQIYRQAGQLLMQVYSRRERPAHLSDRAWNRMMASAGYLFEHLAEVPVLLFAGLKPAPMPAANSLPSELAGATAVMERTSGSSIYPAVQNIILACRAVGLGTVLTTVHTFYEGEVKNVLGLPPEVLTYAMLPIGYPQENAGYGPVRRLPVNQVTSLDQWGNNWPK